MTERINALLSEVESLAAADEKELEALRIKYLGKKGLLNDLMVDFRNVPAEQKRETGQKINALKTALQDKLNALRQSLATKEDSHDDLDLTRTPYPILAPRFLYGRRTGGGRRLARVFFHELRRRPPGTRHAGYVLCGAASRHRAAHPYEQRAEPRDGAHAAAYPRDLPGPRVPQ